MRSCKNCARSSKPCRVAEGSDKCVECVRLACSCDLAPLDTARWKRLEDQRRKLKAELKESYAKQQRLLCQIDALEEKQRVMVDGELQNIEELEREEQQAIVPEVPSLIDVASEQIVFPNDLGEWSFTSLSPFGGSLEVSSGNS